MHNVKHNQVLATSCAPLREAEGAFQEALARHGHASGEAMAAQWYLKHVERAHRGCGR